MIFTAIIASLLTFQTQADEGSRFSPMIEVGSGLESALTSGGANVLLRVGVGLKSSPESTEPGDIVGPEQLVWAHITGDFAFDASGNGPTLPYMDLKIIPVHNQLAIVGEDGNKIMGDLQLLPTVIGRDVRIDQALSVKVSVVGVQFSVQRAMTEQVAVFAQLAADAVGYKLASHVSELGTFQGFHLATLGLEGGVGLFPKQSADGDGVVYRVIVALGGSADFNLGGNAGGGFAVQSDMRAYLSVKANIAKFIQLFVRAGFNSTCNSGHGCGFSPEFMAGATFIF